MKKSFDPAKCIIALNNIKSVLQLREKPISKSEMLKNLAQCGLPTNSTFWSIFRNSIIIEEVSKGMYKFKGKEPIHISALETIKRKYQEYHRKYNKKVIKPEVQEILPEKKKDNVEEKNTTIQSAINLLKEQGYVIFAPIGIMYSKL